MKQSTKLLSVVLAILVAFSCLSVIGSAALDKSKIAYDGIDDAALKIGMRSAKRGCRYDRTIVGNGHCPFRRFIINFRHYQCSCPTFLIFILSKFTKNICKGFEHYRAFLFSKRCFSFVFQ